MAGKSDSNKAVEKAQQKLADELSSELYPALSDEEAERELGIPPLEQEELIQIITDLDPEKEEDDGPGR